MRADGPTYEQVFLSLLFYLMNSNQPQGANPAFQARDDDSYQHRLVAARTDLLRREARAEGIARWLGTSNSSGDYLASAHYPDIANGSAPAPLPVDSSSTEGNSTDSDSPAQRPPTLSEAYRIPPFEPRSDGELLPVPGLVARLFADATPRDSTGREEARVYPQNLTGFAKGTWHTSEYSWGELGLNETWTTQRLVEVADVERGNETGTASGKPTEPGAAASLTRRQGAAPPATNATAPSNFTTVIDVHNRTLTRGTFPWLPSSAHPQSQSQRLTSFNLREVKTSAVGPIEPLPLDPAQLDEAALLRLRAHPEAWEEWEREGPVTYLWGPLSLSAPGEGGSEAKETDLDVEAVQCVSPCPLPDRVLF